MTTNKFKYITASEQDKEWGLYLNTVGKAGIEKNTDYPPAGHPSGYMFDWSKGRILQEYHSVLFYCFSSSGRSFL